MGDRPVSRASASATATVVIPCRNAERWLARAIESVLAQERRPERIIVVDDGSSDGSAAVAKAFGEPVHVESGPGRGACAARNRGLALTRTPFVKFLDADDEVEPPLLAGEIESATTERADLVISAMARLHEGALVREVPPPPHPVEPARLFAEWLHGRQVNPSAQLWRVAFLREIGGWNESVLLNQDAELVMRSLLRGARVGVNTRGRGLYHASVEGSLSKTKSDEKLASLAAFLGAMLPEARGAGFDAGVEALHRALYGVARMGFRLGHARAGQKALAALRDDGFHGHYGGAAHRLGAIMLGLERKVRLWGS